MSKENRMICKVRYMVKGSVIEEMADLPISTNSSVAKVIEAGHAFVATRKPGLTSREDRPKLLSVKPSNLRVPGQPA